FLNQDQGFAFGPGLWVTQNGGAAWTEVDLPAGTRVTDLETVDGQVLAVWARCSGTGEDFAAGCTRFTLEQADAAAAGQRSAWRPGEGASALTSGSGASSAMLTLAGGAIANAASGTGYLLAPDGTLLSGGLAGGSFTAAGQVPATCLPGAP